MNDVASRLCLISPRRESGFSYAELCREIAAPNVFLRPWCRPSSLEDAWREIARAIVFGTELTLFDADWSEGEICALGYSVDQVNTVRVFRGRPQLSPADLAGKLFGSSSARFNLFTSGSTGRPTLVCHPLASLVRSIKVSVAHKDDVWAFAYNPTHMAGLQVFLQALANLNTLVDVAGLSRSETYRAFRCYGISHVSATPTFYRFLLPCDQPLAKVSRVVLGGEASSTALHEQLGRVFPSAKLRNIYASTEAGSLLISSGEIFRVPSTLADDVIVRGGRLHLHRRLVAGFPGAWAQDDWYDTGDCVEVLEASPLSVRFIGRECTLVNVGGHKVNPLEVESRIEDHPAVAACRVFGRDNSVSGQILCAEVVSRDGALVESGLRAYLGAYLQPAKIPRVIRFVDRIAATRSGKQQRS